MKTKRKNKTIIIIGIILFLAVIAILHIEKVSQVAPVSGTVQPLRQVVVDPGHGGEDGGAQANSIVEKDVNLDISLVLAQMLEASGFEVVLTRTEDISIYDESAKSLRDKKRSDILNRLKIANENPNAIMVSVHQNKFEQSKYSGAQMFYGEKNDLSKPLAECLQQSFVNRLQPDNKRVIKPITSSVYLINNAQTPAVLAECGFISNPTEAKNLSDEIYQQKVAFAIFSGILDFYNQV